MNYNSIEKLKLDLSLKAKNGLDFIISASLLWFVITYIGTLPITSYNKGIISISSLLFGLYLPVESMFFIPMFMSVMLVILAVWIFWSYNQKLKSAFNIASSSK